MSSRFSYTSAFRGGTGFGGGYGSGGSSGGGSGSSGGGSSGSSSAPPYLATVDGQQGTYYPGTGTFIPTDGSGMSVAEGNVTRLTDAAGLTSSLPFTTSGGGSRTVQGAQPPKIETTTTTPKATTPTQQQQFSEYTAGLVSQAGSPGMATALSAKYGTGTDYLGQAQARSAARKAEIASTGSKYGLTRAEYLATTQTPGGLPEDVLLEGGQTAREWATEFVGSTPPGYKPIIERDKEGALTARYEFVQYKPGTPVRVPKATVKPSGYEVVGGKAGAGMSVGDEDLARALAGDPSYNPITGRVIEPKGTILPVFAPEQYETVPFSEFLSRTREGALKQGYNAIVTASGQNIGVSYEPLEYRSEAFKGLSPEAQTTVKEARRIQNFLQPTYAEKIGVVPERRKQALDTLLKQQDLPVQMEARNYLFEPVKPVAITLEEQRKQHEAVHKEESTVFASEIEARESFRADQPWIAAEQRFLQQTFGAEQFKEGVGYVGDDPIVQTASWLGETFVGQTQDIAILVGVAHFWPLGVAERIGLPVSTPKLPGSKDLDLYQYAPAKYVSGVFNLGLLATSAGASAFGQRAAITAASKTAASKGVKLVPKSATVALGKQIALGAGLGAFLGGAGETGAYTYEKGVEARDYDMEFNLPGAWLETPAYVATKAGEAAETFQLGLSSLPQIPLERVGKGAWKGATIGAYYGAVTGLAGIAGARAEQAAFQREIRLATRGAKQGLSREYTRGVAQITKQGKVTAETYSGAVSSGAGKRYAFKVESGGRQLYAYSPFTDDLTLTASRGTGKARVTLKTSYGDFTGVSVSQTRELGGLRAVSARGQSFGSLKSPTLYTLKYKGVGATRPVLYRSFGQVTDDASTFVAQLPVGTRDMPIPRYLTTQTSDDAVSFVGWTKEGVMPPSATPPSVRTTAVGGKTPIRTTAILRDVSDDAVRESVEEFKTFTSDWSYLDDIAANLDDATFYEYAGRTRVGRARPRTRGRVALLSKDATDDLQPKFDLIVDADEFTRYRPQTRETRIAQHSTLQKAIERTGTRQRFAQESVTTLVQAETTAATRALSAAKSITKQTTPTVATALKPVVFATATRALPEVKESKAAGNQLKVEVKRGQTNKTARKLKDTARSTAVIKNTVREVKSSGTKKDTRLKELLRGAVKQTTRAGSQVKGLEGVKISGGIKTTSSFKTQEKQLQDTVKQQMDTPSPEPITDFDLPPIDPTPPPIFGEFELNDDAEGRKKRVREPRKRKKKREPKYELAPLADMLSKTITEVRTRKPAASPTVKIAQREWWRTLGQRVPTTEILRKREKRLNHKNKKVKRMRFF